MYSSKNQLEVNQECSSIEENKPVAWMQMHYKYNKPTKFSPLKVWEDDIPLYTHPQKELSDEEILEVLMKTKIDTDFESSTIRFARAIIKESRGEE